MGGWVIKAFVDACETLLGVETVAANLTKKDARILQHYISSLAVKFPAVVKVHLC